MITPSRCKTSRTLVALSLLLCVLAVASCTPADPSFIDDISTSPSAEPPVDDTTLPPHVHSWSEWVVTNPPCCDNAGELRRSCNCGETQIESIEKTEHTPGEWTLIQSPTCAETGMQQIACTGCGEVMEVMVIPKTDHISGEWATVQPPSCAHPGKMQTACILCGAIIETKSIEKTEHTPGEWTVVTQPTSVQSGEKQLHCSICQSVLSTESIPEYALTEAERVAARLKDIQSENTFTFAALADPHVMADSNYSQNINSLKSVQMASKSLSYLEDLIQVDSAVFLGDYTAADRDYTANQVIKDFNLITEQFSNLGNYPVAWLRGNHDINYYASRDRLLTDEELHEYVDKNSRGMVFDPDNPHGGYGYMDFPEAKIRMICLNTVDALAENPAVDGKDAANAGISSMQLQWLIDTALDFSDKGDPSEWGIITLSHHPLDYNYQLKSVLYILDLYRLREPGIVKYTIAGIEYELTFNFKNIIPAEILCSIHGHIHNYNTKKTGGFSSWLWRISIPNLCAGRENDSATSTDQKFANKWGDFDESGKPIYYEKSHRDDETQTYVYDDENGTSYCMITIDRENKKIYAHYVGVGRDRVFDYSS